MQQLLLTEDKDTPMPIATVIARHEAICLSIRQIASAPTLNPNAWASQ
ncbi:MAG: hypothetical protein K0B10_01480 [Vicingaceae bacterium]|nr:hypothetical protein [Vicingaceae bacterium]